jgi:hypothetical protein
MFTIAVVWVWTNNISGYKKKLMNRAMASLKTQRIGRQKLSHNSRMNNAKYYLPLVQALADQKIIQSRNTNGIGLIWQM